MTGMWRSFGVVVGVALVVPTVALAARFKVIDKAALIARVEKLYTAEAAGDWKTFYALLSPEIREKQTYEQFVSDSKKRDFRVISWKITRIRGAEKDEDYPPIVESGAEVAMDVTVERAGGRQSKEGDQTDYWVRLGGEWYWAWRGWPAD